MSEYPLRYELDHMQDRDSVGAWILDDGYVYKINYGIFYDGHYHFVYDYIMSKYEADYQSTDPDDIEYDEVDDRIIQYQDYTDEMSEEAEELMMSYSGSVMYAVIWFWGWIRIMRDSVFMRELSPMNLRRTYNALEEMYGQQAWEDRYLIETIEGDKKYYGVPLELIMDEDVNEIRRGEKFGYRENPDEDE